MLARSRRIQGGGQTGSDGCVSMAIPLVFHPDYTFEWPGTELRGPGPHRHHGDEQCYVLEGDFYTGGQALGAGDFQCARPGSVHQPSCTVNGALVLIVAPADYDPVA